MAQTYTLEEAAEHLNLSVEEFKRRLRTEWTQVRSFRDGSTLRFRANEIDELARSIGLGSSEELPLAEPGGGELPDDIGLARDEGAPTPPPARKGSAGADAPLALSDSDEVFHLSADPSSQRLRAKGDSDVRLEKAARPADDGEESILTDEAQAPGAGGSGKLSGKSGKLSAAKLKEESGKVKGGDSGKKAGDSGKRAGAAASQPPEEDSSEFELSLDADSDEFELSLAQDSSEEVALGELPAEGAGKTGKSGINLTRPTDSGVSLEKRKPRSDDDEVDFELSLDAPGSGKSATKFGSGSGAKKGAQPDSDSEFELTLEEPSDLAPGGSAETAAAPAGEKKGDIFEATDFEIPALEDDSASEVVSLEGSDTDLEASSDFDLALDEADASAEDESASEVVALEDRGRKGRKKRAEDDDDAVDFDSDLEEGPSASKALRNVRADEDDDEEYAVGEEEREEDEERRTVAAAPTEWGGLTVAGMFLTLIVMFLGGVMAYELLHSVWGYQQGTTPATPLVSFFADTAGMKPAQ